MCIYWFVCACSMYVYTILLDIALFPIVNFVACVHCQVLIKNFCTHTKPTFAYASMYVCIRRVLIQENGIKCFCTVVPENSCLNAIK